MRRCPFCDRPLLRDELCSCEIQSIQQKSLELKQSEAEAEQEVINEEIRRMKEREETKEKIRKISEDAKTVKGSIELSYKNIFTKPFRSLKELSSETDITKISLIFFVYLFLFSSVLTLLFSATSVSTVLGPKMQLGNFSKIGMFFILFFSEFLAIIFRFFWLKMFINKEKDIPDIGIAYVFSQGLIYSILLLGIAIIIGFFIPYLALILTLFGFILQTLAFYNASIFYTQNFDGSLINTIFVFLINLIAEFFIFYFLFYFFL